jgi:hypothetical protein
MCFDDGEMVVGCLWGMREERRGWERGLYGVRGNEVEKEEGDLKRSRGGV